MARIAQYKCTLGLASHAGGVLDASSSAVVDTLEEYGHTVSHFRASSARRLTMECDSYHVELRLRRTPLPAPAQACQAAADCTAKLEIMLRPLHADRNGGELDERLLAIIVQRLLLQVDAVYVQWLHAPAAVPRDAFLGAFKHPDVPGRAACPSAEPLPGAAAAAGRPRFAPVDEAVAGLEAHCEKILQLARDRASGRLADAAAARARARMRGALARARSGTPARTGWAAKLSPSSIAGPVLRQGGLRFGVQALAAGTLFLLLESAAAVRAAVSHLP